MHAIIAAFFERLYIEFLTFQTIFCTRVWILIRSQAIFLCFLVCCSGLLPIVLWFFVYVLSWSFWGLSWGIFLWGVRRRALMALLTETQSLRYKSRDTRKYMYTQNTGEYAHDQSGGDYMPWRHILMRKEVGMRMSHMPPRNTTIFHRNRLSLFLLAIRDGGACG